MFELASRLKFRFDSPKGQLSADDLWDLPLTSTLGKANLDDIAKGLHKQIKTAEEVDSFVVEEKKTDDIIQKKFELVKYIIDTLKAEKQSAANAAEKAAQRNLINGLIAKRKEENLNGKTLEELIAMRDNL